MAAITNTSAEEQPTKKLKLEKGNSEDECESVHNTLKDLSNFKVDHILNNNTSHKVVCLKGTFENKQGDALVILEKTAFSEENLQSDSDYFTTKSWLEKVFDNDIYGNYKYFPKIELNSIKATVIHPADEKVIRKYTQQQCYIVEETADVYSQVVLPHLVEEAEKNPKHLLWVYNILERKSEVERIALEDTDSEIGFTLLPDLKWNGEKETLYLLAIVRKHGIKSLRDLNKDHLPLLRNIKSKGIATIEEKYGLNVHQLRIYLHYHPSFFHLHVHFCALRHDAPGILTERAHLLSTVINNIELCPDYYQKATIPFTVRENDKLFKKLQDQGFIKTT